MAMLRSVLHDGGFGLRLNYGHFATNGLELDDMSLARPAIVQLLVPASVAQLDAPSDWRPEGRGFNPRRDRQHSFVEIDHEIVSTVILSLPLIQEG